MSWLLYWKSSLKILLLFNKGYVCWLEEKDLKFETGVNIENNVKYIQQLEKSMIGCLISWIRKCELVMELKLKV